MRINHNIAAINANRQLFMNSMSLQKSLERLSSGLRINRAADDAAGLAISEKMRAQIKGIDRAGKNAEDGISMIQTAEGALSEVHSMLDRMRELAIQAANDTLTNTDRLHIQKEIDQLKDEVDRISRTTEFNTKKLLDGTASALVSTDKRSTEVIVRGGLRLRDEFGQAWVRGGNYRLSIESTAGVGQEMKSDIFKVKHGNDIVDLYINESSNIANTEVHNLPVGSYEIAVGDSTFLAGATAYVFSSAGADISMTYRQRNATAGALVAVNADADDQNNASILFEVRDINTGAGTIAVRAYAHQYTRTAGYYYSYKDLILREGNNTAIYINGTTFGTESGIDFDSIVVTALTSFSNGDRWVVNYQAGLDVSAAANTYTAGSETVIMRYVATADFIAGVVVTVEVWLEGVHTSTGITVPAGGISQGGTIVHTATITGVYTFTGVNWVEFGYKPNVETTETAHFAIGDANSYIVGGYRQSSYVQKFRFNDVVLDGSATDPTKINFHLFYLDEKNGEVRDGSNDMSWTGQPAGMSQAVTYRMKKGQMGLDYGVADRWKKLYDIDKFWDSSGNFMLEEPKTLTITQGDGTQASVVLYGSDTIQDVIDKLNEAVGTTLGQLDYVDEINKDNFVTFVDQPSSGDTPEALEGTIVIRSAIPGARGELNFAGDQSVINALSLAVIQDSTENKFNVDVTDAHTGDEIVTDVEVEGNMLVGVIHPNVDVRIDPNSGLSVTWNNNSKKWMYEGGSGETFIHLVDNTAVLQIGPNAGQDLDLDIGQMDTIALGIDNLLVSDRKSASTAIGKVDSAIDRISGLRAQLGAAQNRLEHTVSNLSVAYENLVAAESRIRDADMAKEMMDFTKSQILQQSGVAMLAQANQLPQSILQLLGGG